MALLFVPVVGAMALGGEVSGWFMTQRTLQNAADSAVLAAAQRGDGSYASEATAVVKKYGLTPSAALTVSPTIVTCPAGAPVVAGFSCYQVQIDQIERVYMSALVGFRGETTVGGKDGKRIRAAAIAGTVAGSKGFCLTAVQNLTVNGAGGSPDFGGCDFLSGSNMACTGTNANVGITHGFAGGTNGTGGGSNYCGAVHQASYTFPSNPWASKVANNLANTPHADSDCPRVASISSLNAGVNCFRPLTDGTQITLSGNVSVANPNTVLVIKNGGLNIGSRTLSTAGGGSLTLVYTGATGAADVLSSSGGIFDVAAPTAADTSRSTDWSGMTIVEDSSLTGQNHGGTNTRDIAFTGSGGSALTFRMTGLVYLPNADFDVGGAINHATNSDYGTYVGQNCFAVYANNIRLNGTVDIFDNPAIDCVRAGLEDLPKVPLVRLLG